MYWKHGCAASLILTRELTPRERIRRRHARTARNGEGTGDMAVPERPQYTHIHSPYHGTNVYASRGTPRGPAHPPSRCGASPLDSSETPLYAVRYRRGAT
jgi:hypothetical protein